MLNFLSETILLSYFRDFFSPRLEQIDTSTESTYVFYLQFPFKREQIIGKV